MKQRTLHYESHGEGTPVILIHGVLSNSKLAWEQTVPALARYHRVITVDRRGHGLSPAEPTLYTIAGDAQDVVAVANETGCDTFHLVAHSYGGIIALQMAALAPQRVQSLHLIEPPLLKLMPHDPLVSKLADDEWNVRQKAPELSDEQLAAQFLTMVAGADLVTRIKDRPVWHDLVAEARRIKYEQSAQLFDLALLEAIPHHVPRRVYSGGRSNPALRRLAVHMAATLPHTGHVEFADAFHDVQRIGEPFEHAVLNVTRRIGP